MPFKLGFHASFGKQPRTWLWAFTPSKKIERNPDGRVVCSGLGRSMALTIPRQPVSLCACRRATLQRSEFLQNARFRDTAGVEECEKRRKSATHTGLTLMRT